MVSSLARSSCRFLLSSSPFPLGLSSYPSLSPRRSALLADPPSSLYRCDTLFLNIPSLCPSAHPLSATFSCRSTPSVSLRFSPHIHRAHHSRPHPQLRSHIPLFPYTLVHIRIRVLIGKLCCTFPHRFTADNIYDISPVEAFFTFVTPFSILLLVNPLLSPPPLPLFSRLAGHLFIFQLCWTPCIMTFIFLSSPFPHPLNPHSSIVAVPLVSFPLYIYTLPPVFAVNARQNYLSPEGS